MLSPLDLWAGNLDGFRNARARCASEENQGLALIPVMDGPDIETSAERVSYETVTKELT
jgi:hypothetical protein